MGYFSDLAIDCFYSYEDNSYPSPERQLLWRSDDLKDRLEKLIAEGASCRNGYIYSESDIRYVLAEHLSDISEVERAIELAKEELLNKYDINTYETEKADLAKGIDSEIQSEDSYEQIAFVDIILLAILSQKRTLGL